jgi:hypothetical protein
VAQPHSIISPKEGAELKRLHEEYAVATKRAGDALRANDGQRFLQEEERVADIVRRIKEILGTTGQPWNA